MATMDAQQIYENFHGPVARGTGALESAQQAAYELAQAYHTEAVATQRLINDIGSGWTGQSAEAASQGLVPLAENLLATGDDLNVHQDLVYRQAHSYHRAAAQVAPVPPAPSMTDVTSVASAALITGNADLASRAQSMYHQVQARNAVGQANVDAYHNYVQASTYNAANLPAMSNTLSTASPAPISVNTPPPVSGKAVHSGQGGVPGPISARTAQPVRASGAQSVSAATPDNPGDRASPGGGSGVTHPMASTPSLTSASVGGPNTSVHPVIGSAPPPAPDSGPGGDPSIMPAGPTPPITDGGPGGRRTMAGADTLDEPPTGGRAPAAPPEPTGAGTSGRPGGTPADEQALAHEHAASGTTADPTEPAPMGTGRGATGDDTEHRRGVPLSADPEVFDEPDTVAPPVLGETAEQYQQRLARETRQHR